MSDLFLPPQELWAAVYNAKAWSARFPNEPGPHTWHRMPDGKWILDFWEEPGEGGKLLMGISGVGYAVVKKVGKLRIKPVT